MPGRAPPPIASSASSTRGRHRSCEPASLLRTADDRRSPLSPVPGRHGCTTSRRTTRQRLDLHLRQTRQGRSRAVVPGPSSSSRWHQHRQNYCHFDRRFSRGKIAMALAAATSAMTMPGFPASKSDFRQRGCKQRRAWSGGARGGARRRLGRWGSGRWRAPGGAGHAAVDAGKGGLVDVCGGGRRHAHWTWHLPLFSVGESSSALPGPVGRVELRRSTTGSVLRRRRWRDHDEGRRDVVVVAGGTPAKALATASVSRPQLLGSASRRPESRRRGRRAARRASGGGRAASAARRLRGAQSK